MCHLPMLAPGTRASFYIILESKLRDISIISIYIYCTSHTRDAEFCLKVHIRINLAVFISLSFPVLTLFLFVCVFFFFES